jgi:4-carboxymuconolactone decarboxylase
VTESDHERGAKLGQRLGGESFERVVRSLSETDAELAAYLVAHAYGTIWSRPGLSLADRELVVIAALASQGFLPQLKWHIGAALNLGVEPETLREVLIQVVPFAGWPAALNALGVMREAFAERNIPLADVPRPPASPLGREALRARGLERGGQVYADYAGIEQTLADYDPELAGYLTEHAYGQIYDRPGLDMRRRELIAVAMLTALQRLPQLAGHLVGAHRVGCSALETKEVIVTLTLYVGWPAALNALEVWKRHRT